MLLRHLPAVILAAFIFVTPAFAQEDAIGVPGPILFENTQFDLAWSSHPTLAYYKQEYLPKGQAVETYGQMIMVELLLEGKSPKSAAADMIMALEKRRGTDPVLNYEIIENQETGEVLLDFLLSGDASPPLVVEWNAYRYVPYEDGLVLFAISRRGYNDGASTFLGGLKDWRQSTVAALASMTLPEIAPLD